MTILIHVGRLPLLGSNTKKVQRYVCFLQRKWGKYTGSTNSGRGAASVPSCINRYRTELIPGVLQWTGAQETRCLFLIATDQRELTSVPQVPLYKVETGLL